MKLTTKGRYGLKAAFYLAYNFGEGPVTLKEIAEREQIAEKYLEQLLASLKKDGIVSSIRGAKGGYELAKPPKHITINHILTALEGDLAIVDCLKSDACCSKERSCVTKNVWQRIDRAITTALDSITLEDMVQDYKRNTEL